MYSFPNFEPLRCSMSDSSLLLALLQVSQETGKVVWYLLLSKNFSQSVAIHTVKGFCIVNEAEVGMFLESSCFFYDPAYAGNLIFGYSAFSQYTLYIWKFLVHVLLKPTFNDFQDYLYIQFSSVAQLCPTLCDPMNRSTPALPVRHQLPFTQTPVC